MNNEGRKKEAQAQEAQAQLNKLWPQTVLGR